MPVNIKLYFRSGRTQFLENIHYTENLRKQLNNRIDAGVIIDYEVF